jgi:hypothetical protein
MWAVSHSKRHLTEPWQKDALLSASDSEVKFMLLAALAIANTARERAAKH